MNRLFNLVGSYFINKLAGSLRYYTFRIISSQDLKQKSIINRKIIFMNKKWGMKDFPVQPKNLVTQNIIAIGKITVIARGRKITIRRSMYPHRKNVVIMCA